MAGGDLEAFQKFGDIAAQLLASYFQKRWLSLTEARDLAASCVTDIARKLMDGAFRGGNFQAWFFTIAHNRLVKHWQTRQTAEVADAGWLQEIPLVAPPEANPLIQAAVRRAVGKLSERDRRILDLRYSRAELAFQEIGEELGMTEGAVRAQHHRVLKRLERDLCQEPTLKIFLARCVGHRLAEKQTNRNEDKSSKRTGRT